MEHEHDHSVAPAKEPSQLHEGTQSEDQSEDQIDEVAYPGSGTVSLEPSDEKDEGRFDSSVLLPLVALAFTYVGKLSSSSVPRSPLTGILTFHDRFTNHAILHRHQRSLHRS